MKRIAGWTCMALAVLAIQMSGRILTPNGDGLNDGVLFTLASSQTAPLQTHVYDMRGRRIAHLLPVSSTQVRWDGRDDAGRPVSSGPYLVQISQEASQWSGVVVVAK